MDDDPVVDVDYQVGDGDGFLHGVHRRLVHALAAPDPAPGARVLPAPVHRLAVPELSRDDDDDDDVDEGKNKSDRNKEKERRRKEKSTRVAPTPT